MSSGRRFAILGLGGLLAWYVCTLLFWALQPLTDRVPVGVDYTRKNPQPTSVRVECNTVLRSAARGNSPLPALAAQPVGNPALAYAYAPCSRTHRQARTLLVLDTAVVLGAVTLAVWLGLRARSQLPGAAVPSR